MIRYPTQVPRAYGATIYATRCTHSYSSSALYNHKYAEKLQQKAKEKGLDLDMLKSQAREEARCKQKEEAASLLASFKKPAEGPPPAESFSNVSQGRLNVRKDSSPMKPLSSILNMSKLMATPHTPSQISVLWTAYHASRNKGTGRGFICASLTLESYIAMIRAAKSFPVFVLPVPKESVTDLSARESTDTAHELFFLQWDFYPSPSGPATSGGSYHIPELSTVLFTPLQEYKLRTSFATPYLVLTFYTDMSQSHGIVLLRGEITPTSASAPVQPGKDNSDRFLLNQVDAQLLAMGLQRFYLWGDDGKEDGHDLTAKALLKQFHEEPEKFDWQDLLKLSNIVP